MYREIVDKRTFLELPVNSYCVIQNTRIALEKISLTALVKLYKYPICLDIK